MRATGSITVDAPVGEVYGAFFRELVAPVDPLTAAELAVLDAESPPPPPISHIRVLVREPDSRLVLSEANDQLTTISHYRFTAVSDWQTQVEAIVEVDLSMFRWWQRAWITLMFRVSVRRDLVDELRRITTEIVAGTIAGQAV